MSAEVIRVIRTTSVIGRGVEDDYCRDITQFWTEDGQLLATVDRWLERWIAKRSEQHEELTDRVTQLEGQLKEANARVKKACDQGAALGNALSDVRKILTERGAMPRKARRAINLIDGLRVDL